MRQSSKVALGGVMGALAVACMLLTVFPYMTYALPAAAGVMLIPIVIELGLKTGWMVYAVAALLSLLVAPDKEAAILFVAFFGYYPLIKAALERLNKRVVEWAVKLAVFNAAMIAAYLVLLFVLGLDPEAFELFGIQLPYVFLLLGNGVFVIYDVALTNVITLYVGRLHKTFARIFK